MKRLTAWLLLAAALLCLLPGCAGREKQPYVPTGDALSDADADLDEAKNKEETREQNLCLVYYPDRHLNPFLTVDYTNRTLLPLVYQSLFVTDSNYQVYPMLCERFSVNEEADVYTFYLAEATFSDGSRLTPGDVVASLNTARENPMYQGRFFFIGSVYESPDGGVTVETDIPMENLPILLDMPILKAGQQEAERPLGTGAYFFDSTTGGLRLRRRTDWWCKTKDFVVTTSSISLVKAESTTQIRDEFEFADVSLVCADPGSDSYADYRCDYELWDCPTGLFLYLGFNADSEVLTTPEKRAVLTYGIDRELLAEEYFRGFASPASLPAAPGSPYYNPGLAANYSYDLEKFKQSVSSAGLTGKTLQMLVTEDDSLRLRTARAVEKMLEAGGLEVEITTCPIEEFNFMLNMRLYDIYLSQTKLPPNMDLSQYFYVYGSLSFGHMDDELTYNQCKDTIANYGNFQSLHKKIMEEGLLCPILFRDYAVYAIRGTLTGLRPARDNVFFYTRGITMQDAQVLPGQVPGNTDPEE